MYKQSICIYLLLVIKLLLRITSYESNFHQNPYSCSFFLLYPASSNSSRRFLFSMTCFKACSSRWLVLHKKCWVVKSLSFSKPCWVNLLIFPYASINSGTWYTKECMYGSCSCINLLVEPSLIPFQQLVLCIELDALLTTLSTIDIFGELAESQH